MASGRQTVPPAPSTTATQGPPSAIALVVAAKAALAERPPSAITGRELAARAGVNYGLLHRHFGSKSALLARALDGLIAECAVGAFDGDGLPTPLAVARHEQMWRSLVHVLLDRDGLGEHRHRAPVQRRCLMGVRARRPDLDDDQARAIVALAMAIEVGIPVHRPILARGVGLRTNDPAIDHLVAQWLRGLYRGTGPLGGVPGRGDATGTYRRQAETGHDDVARLDTGAHGRLVVAGARLLADRAPSSIAGRELAAAAGVNYGLIRHYFGTKDEVLRQSMQLLRDRFSTDEGGPSWSPRLFATCEHPGYVRAMTWAALDPSLATAEQSFPVMDRMVERLVGGGSHDRELAMRVAILTAVAAQMAWALCLSVLQLGLGVDPRELEPLVAPLPRSLLVDPTRDTNLPG